MAHNENHWKTSSHLWRKIKHLAHEMRTNPTPAEDKLWQRLRRKQIHGVKFRRQHTIGRFIVDFYCKEAALVIEVDGPTHQCTQAEDALRTEFLQSQGVTVIRFSNGAVWNHLDVVVERIAEHVAGPLQHP
ncbi:MAG: endonuclease domain-containing protein [Chloroflexota bacterium]